MEMSEQGIDLRALVVWLHIICGSVALVASVVPLIVVKGSKTHKLGGKVFVGFMTVSSLVGGIMGWFGGSMLLAFVGALALWHMAVATATLKGNGFLLGSKAMHTVLVFSFIAILITTNTLNYLANGWDSTAIILGVFSGIGLGTAFGEVRALLAPAAAIAFSAPANPRMRRHVGHSMGAFISCWSAFLVVNQPFPIPMLNWLLPTAIGSIGIIYWTRKVSNGWRMARANS